MRSRGAAARADWRNARGARPDRDNDNATPIGMDVLAETPSLYPDAACIGDWLTPILGFASGCDAWNGAFGVSVAADADCLHEFSGR